MTQRLLPGEIMPDPEPDTAREEIENLKRINRDLNRELGELRSEREQLTMKLRGSATALLRIQKKLDPFYQLLRAVFGEISSMELVDDGNPTAAAPGGGAGPALVSDHKLAVWDEWKQKLGGAAAKIITALLKHGHADTGQLCVLIGTQRRRTVHDGIHVLKNAGLIEKNGEIFSLKKL